MTEPTTPRPSFDSYDPAVAEMMTTSAGGMGGIPDYLGIRTTHVGPGTMTAELDVRPDLLNPFGSAHGGTLAALADPPRSAPTSNAATAPSSTTPARGCATTSSPSGPRSPPSGATPRFVTTAPSGTCHSCRRCGRREPSPSPTHRSTSRR
jgi:hypothetical protein